MFASRYQGGAAVEVADVAGSQPLAAWAISHPGAARRVYDRAVKGYVHVLDAGPHTSIQLPKKSHQKLSLEQPFFVVQIQLPVSPILCSFELSIMDTTETRRRLLFTTSTNVPSINPSQARLPIPESVIARGRWVNLCIDLADFVSSCFQQHYRSLEGIVFRPNCSIRKIFTLRCPPSDLDVDVMENLPAKMYSYFSPIPRTLDYTLGVEHQTQILNYSMIRRPENNPTKPQASPKLKLKNIIKRTRIRNSNEFPEAVVVEQKTPRKPITRRRLTISPSVRKTPLALRQGLTNAKDDLDLSTKENPPKAPAKLLSPLRLKSPVLKEKRSYENIPFSPKSLSPILSEKSHSVSDKSPPNDAVQIVRIPSVAELETFNVPTAVSEKSIIQPSQSSSNTDEKPKLEEDVPSAPSSLPKSDDDNDVVLMGDFSTSDDEKLADWQSDAEEVDFVRDALRFAKPPTLRSNRSSMEDLKIVSNRSSLEKSKLDEIREQLRPVRVVKARSFSRHRTGGDCSSRCSTTSTSSFKDTVDVDKTSDTPGKPPGPELMFDPILNLYFDPNTNKYFEVR